MNGLIGRLLIVEDDPGVSDVVDLLLTGEGHDVQRASAVGAALEQFKSGAVDLVVTDLRLPDGTGLDLIRALHELDRALPIILMTSYSSMESAIEALRAGAVDYIVKPFNNEEFLHSVRRALNERRIIQENAALRRNLKSAFAPIPIIGESPAIRKVKDLLLRIGPSESNVLISGETGTGKELVALELHSRGPRSDGPFIPVNCGASPPQLLENELFGGPGAGEGLIREAHRGTLFLEEVSELSAALQVKLVRAIQEKAVRHSGARQFLPADVRYITATHRNLSTAVEQGQFRRDLHLSLNVVSLDLPPLRERGGDVLLLATHFLEKHARRMGKRIEGFDAEFGSFMANYPWPGNVRELENFIERSVLLARGSGLTGRDLAEVAPALPMFRASDPAPGGRPLAIEEYIREVVERFQATHSESDIAKMLGIGRKALWMRRRQWGLKRKKKVAQ